MDKEIMKDLIPIFKKMRLNIDQSPGERAIGISMIAKGLETLQHRYLEGEQDKKEKDHCNQSKNANIGH